MLHGIRLHKRPGTGIGTTRQSRREVFVQQSWFRHRSGRWLRTPSFAFGRRCQPPWIGLVALVRSKSFRALLKARPTAQAVGTGEEAVKVSFPRLYGVGAVVHVHTRGGYDVSQRNDQRLMYSVRRHMSVDC